ncbi:hypothetical protein J2X69_005110 [Algoriphagus sp. 4150]|uniref:IS982 family transposase n=1 Tax=Algoriphagus sp. 4150 TaxID=2817756 RepID=UPI0028567899|nr:IS982 family transposase [Algoriphagus sp. 4150]MDR7132736.1 hypothetical protein [Algoriphagus sp. 4150]
MQNIKSNLGIIFHSIKPLNLSFFVSSGNLSKLYSGSEIFDFDVVTHAQVGEFMSFDSENWLFNNLVRDYWKSFSKPLDRSKFNRKKRGFFLPVVFVQKKSAERFLSYEDNNIIYSIRLQDDILSWERQSIICAEAFETVPERKFCAAHNKFFDGHKLKRVCSGIGISHYIEFIKATIYDVNFFYEIHAILFDRALIGDMGCSPSSIQLNLFISQISNLKSQ